MPHPWPNSSAPARSLREDIAQRQANFQLALDFLQHPATIELTDDRRTRLLARAHQHAAQLLSDSASASSLERAFTHPSGHFVITGAIDHPSLLNDPLRHWYLMLIRPDSPDPTCELLDHNPLPPSNS